MKKVKFLLSMLVMAAALGFTACSDDDEEDKIVEELVKEIEEETDVREQAVGNYSYTTTLYVEEDGKLVPFASELAELAEVLDVELNESDFQFKGTATVAKSGDNKILIKEDETDGDQWLLNNIREASNGFIFDVEKTTIDEVEFTNYDGYYLEGETKTYGGGYTSASKKLEFYIYTSFGEFMDAALEEAELSDEDVEDLAQLLVAAGYTEEDAEEDANQKVVVEFTLIKK